MPSVFATLIFVVFSNLQCVAVWTGFDFVRPRPGSWGSESNIPFIKYDLPRLNNSGGIDGRNFGYSVANIGDIDGNGVSDIAVGAIGESVRYISNGTVHFKAGGIYIMLMNITGGVLNMTHINSVENGGPRTIAGDQFGFSICAMGDMDGDSIPDIAVGAPGTILSSVYILFLHSNATVKGSTLIRGEFQGSVFPPTNTTNNSTTPLQINTTSPNGPPIRYGSKFGTSLANIGDFNGDNVTDLAVGAVDSSSGVGTVYLLFLDRYGIVTNYTSISPGLGGFPVIDQFFSGFGVSVLLLGDLDRNNVSDLAIGARNYQDPNSLNPQAGAVFICMMDANGTVMETRRISEFSQALEGMILPVVPRDECGASLTSLGDLNMDHMRQHRPDEWANPPRRSVPDLIMGCPQTFSASQPGRIFLTFLTEMGALAGYKAIPAATDEGVAPELDPVDQFGRSLAAYWDVDGNGITELLVGAPGDDDAGIESGAVYMVFLRRRRYHGPVFNYVRFVLLVTLLPWFCCMMIIAGVLYFLWRFRRLPDEVEVIVKASGLEINPHRKRPKYAKQLNAVYCEEYPL